MTTNDFHDYEVVAAGGGEKLERWGGIYLLRPDPQAIWPAPFDLSKDKRLHARYARSSTGGGRWEKLKSCPDEWQIGYRDLRFLIKLMGFKHTGLFPEQAYNWNLMRDIAEKSGRQLRVLNLFGYTGGATVALSKSGAHVTHVDAAKNMVERAGENARLTGCPDTVRYIVDDCNKFVTREIKRGKTYDAVLMDPPSYGRGPNGEMWKLEDSLYDLTKNVTQLLDNPQFFLINSYTTGLQPTVIKNILRLCLTGGDVMAYELSLPITTGGIELPAGCSGLYTAKRR